MSASVPAELNRFRDSPGRAPAQIVVVAFACQASQPIAGTLIMLSSTAWAIS